MRRHHSDAFYVVLDAARRMMQGLEIFLWGASTNPYTYPPLAAFTAVPLVLLPPALERPVFALVNGLAYAGACAIAARFFAPLLPPAASARPPHWVFYAALAAIYARFFAAQFEYPTYDRVVILFVVLAAVAAARSRWRTAGVVAGIGGALKATPLLFVALLAARRRWDGVIALLATAALASLAIDFVFPRGDGGWWIVEWARLVVLPAAVGGAEHVLPWSASSALNQSLVGTLQRILQAPQGGVALDPGIVRAITLAAQAGVLALLVAAITARTGSAARDEAFHTMMQAGAVICAMLLLSPMSSREHFGALLLPIGMLLIAALYRARDPAIIATLAATFLVGPLSGRDIGGRWLPDALAEYGALTWIALAQLAVSARMLRRAAPRDLARSAAGPIPR